MARLPRTAVSFGTVFVTAGAILLLLAVGVGDPRTLQSSPPTGVTRVYYIGADPVLWNYTPSGTNEITGTPIGASNATVEQYTARNATYLGTSFEKCLYRQYLNASFTTLLPRPPSEAYLGLLGPVIYAAVGDTVDVWFHNTCPWPESIAPEGVQVAPPSDGTNYNGSVYYGGSVPTNGTVEYTWQVPTSAGPGSTGAPSALWLYNSGTQLGNSTDLGLVGPILISAPGDDNPNGTPSGSATNVILLLSDVDENNSTFLRYNVEHFAEDPSAVDLTSPTWVQSLHKYSINGFLYGNLPLLTFPSGAEVDWWLLGSGEGYPTATWQGNPVDVGGARTTAVPLIPDVTEHAVMWANSSGTWLVGAAELAESEGGMEARYAVAPAGSAAALAASDHPVGSESGSPTRSSPNSAGSVDLWGAVRWV